MLYTAYITEAESAKKRLQDEKEVSLVVHCQTSISALYQEISMDITFFPPCIVEFWNCFVSKMWFG